MAPITSKRYIMDTNEKSGTLTLADELRKRLHYGETHFWFRKDNGEEREAYGTLNFDDIPEDKLPKGTGKTNPFVVAFYDTQKEAWRSCRATSIISIEPLTTGKPIEIDLMV